MNGILRTGTKCALLLSTALVGAIGSSAASAQEVQQEAASNSSGLAEIVVTAQRREERSQDVPIVITALNPEALRERGITSVQGLQSQVPSLLVQPNGQSSRDVMSPAIRGQGASFQGAPGVVVYMNEIPLPIGFTLSMQGGVGNFVDLQSAQVLTGVQGTLFGRNTTGGAILLTAARPTDKLEGYISGSFGNYNLAELEAIVNVPVSETLKVRVVGQSRDRDGFTQDINWNKDRDNIHSRMARVGLQWDPTDTVSNYTMAYYGYSKTNGTGIVPIALNIPLLQGFTAYNRPTLNFCPTTGANADPTCSSYSALISDQQARGIRKVAHGMDDFAKSETWGVSNSTDVDLTDGVKLRNIISFASLKSFFASDQDGTTSNLNNHGVSTRSRTAPKDHYELFTEELQLQGEALDNKLTYTVGGFYSKQKPGGKMEDFSTTVCALPGESGALTCAGYRTMSMTNESKAVFAQATVDLGALTPALNRLRLTGGYRYTWDNINGYSINYSPAVYGGTGADNVNCSFNGASVARINASNPYNAASNPGCRYEGRVKSSAPNWTIGIDYRPIDNLLLYSKVSRGYKAGGLNAYAVNQSFAQFGPEFVTDWEAGFKSDFKVAGRPVRLNVNGFNMDYDKIQRALADYNPTTFKSGAATLSVATARIRGIEVEAMFKPTDNLEIGGNYSYIDAKYKSFKYTAPQAVWDCNSDGPGSGSPNPEKTTSPDLTCIPLQYLSPNTFSVYGRLSLPTADSFGEVSLFVNYAWTDSRHQSGPSLEKFPGTNITWEPGSSLASYGLLNASLDWKGALGSNVDVSLFGTNLTNKTYAISNSGVYNSVGSQSQIFGEPRMYGVRLKYAFGK